MDRHVDKENIKVNTKIPIPVAPLPALPSHLLKKTNERAALNTLAGPNDKNLPGSSNSQTMAGPSTLRSRSKIIANRPKSPFRLDTRFVTVHRGCGVSSLNYEAPREDRRKSVDNAICISSDDECDSKQKALGTPNLQKLQPARVRNIKRSLKRPHSRELQGVSPVLNKKRCEDERAKRRLSFGETVLKRMQSPDLLQKSYMETMNRQYTMDILTHLITVETKIASPPMVQNNHRACVINWLMKINNLDGNPATIQTAIWYLDSILSMGSVALGNMQLVAAACYWIATKVQGPATSASKLVQYSNNAFTVAKLQAAELIILAKLNFPKPAVVVQDFLGYFAWWCQKEKPGEIEVAATFMCLCGMMVNKSLCHEYPSVIAAASIRNTLVLLKKKELIPRLQKCITFVTAENKGTNISNTCSLLQHAVRTVACEDYDYRFLYDQYGAPPKYIAQTIVDAVNELAIVSARTSAQVF